MKKFLLLLCLVLLVTGCQTQDRYLSFPCMRGMLSSSGAWLGPSAPVKAEGIEEACFYLLLCFGFPLSIDLILGVYTFPHDIYLCLKRVGELSSGRKSFNELPPHLRDRIAREKNPSEPGHDPE
ncbi:MAG: hypothetical protein ACYTHM_04700 [Planctomycetota bacterium]|jgi:hypothetical protein